MAQVKLGALCLGVPQEVAEVELIAAAVRAGLPEREDRAAVRSGWGEQRPATRDLVRDDGLAEGPSREDPVHRSRFFTFSAEGSSEECWMFLDDYERREDYDHWMKAVREDP